MYKLEILHPVGMNEAEGKRVMPAPRPVSLDGMRVGLLWNKKRGGLEALTHAGNLLRDRYRGLTTTLYEGSQPCREEVVERAARECDVVVASTGD
jgi:hypothetical protein